MERNLGHMASQTFDLIIIGGGITGACIAWDAALRGLKVALVEKQDFSQATSSAPSKLIHGGLRYLKNLEFGLVRESLRERRLLEVIAPHQVDPLPFLLPAYGWGMKGLGVLTAGMVLYEALSYDKQWLADRHKKLSPFKVFNRRQILAQEPSLPQKDLTGGFVYYDCLMHSPERLTLDFLLSAAAYGAQLANYAEVTGFIQADKTIGGVIVQDVLNGESHQLHGTVTVNASGPWADILLGLMTSGQSERKLVRSKGIHIITRQIIHDRALTLASPGGRHLFLIPWRGHTLIGTTDKEYQGDPDHFKVTRTDIAELLAEVNALYPAAALTMDDVKYFYGGLRPIVEEETTVETYKASRKYELYDHADSGLQGLLTVIGGKYTTSRHLAEQLVDKVYHKLGRVSPACRTQEVHICGGQIDNFSEFVKTMQNTYFTVPAALIQHLSRNYGHRLTKVLQIAQQDPANFVAVSEQEPDIMAEVLYGMRFEMAQSLGDIVLRRTGLGTLGYPGPAVIDKIMAVMAAELGWSTQRQEQERQRLELHYQPLPE